MSLETHAKTATMPGPTWCQVTGQKFATTLDIGQKCKKKKEVTLLSRKKERKKESCICNLTCERVPLPLPTKFRKSQQLHCIVKIKRQCFSFRHEIYHLYCLSSAKQIFKSLTIRFRKCIIQVTHSSGNQPGTSQRAVIFHYYLLPHQYQDL